MGIPALAAASLLSALPAWVAWLTSGRITLDGASSAALALFPWLAIAPLPRGGATAERGVLRGAILVGAFSLPPIALGLGLDLASGRALGPLARSAGLAWAVLLAWALSADLARGSRVAQGLYSGLWLVSIPCAAALQVAVHWAAGPPKWAGGPAWLALADPLVWVHRWGRPGGLERAGESPALLPLLSVLVVLALVAAARSADRTVGVRSLR